jgi:NAD-dependent dihydropyrimidine dehydrogenase PreA subunit
LRREVIVAMPKAKAKDKTKEKQVAEPKFRFCVDESACIGCGICVETCPNDILELRDGHPFAYQPEDCEGCEVCVAVCDQEAIEIEEL